jgi:hypothetical protein
LQIEATTTRARFLGRGHYDGIKVRVYPVSTSWTD